MTQYSAIIFDYGNTLIEFSKTQLLDNDRAFHRTLVDQFGPIDFDRLHQVRMRDRRVCYEGSPPEYREGDMTGITAACIRELFGCDAPPEVVAALTDVRRNAFIECIRLPDYVPPLLESLRTRYRIGLLSNYICGVSIRKSLDNIGLAPYFDAVVVSADVGYVKPHPLPFQRITDALGAAPHECLFVGDNWLADVQGAKRAGMDMCLTRQFLHYEVFNPQPGDHHPDYTIQHLLELEDLLARA